MIREFRDVPLPREHDAEPLIEGADHQLANSLAGTVVSLEDVSGEEPRHPPAAPLGTVLEATAAGDHVLAHIAIDTASFGAGEIANMIEQGELVFGLWGVGKFDPETRQWLEIRPTSVRLTPRRRLSRRA